MLADCAVDTESRDWTLVAVEHVLIRTFSGNLQKQPPRLLADGNLTPARFAVDDHRFLLDVVFEERAHFSGPHTVVHYQGQYGPVPQVLSGLKEPH
ncbi:hypothetical protein ES708_22416 [subsurface metagenome]